MIFRRIIGKIETRVVELSYVHSREWECEGRSVWMSVWEDGDARGAAFGCQFERMGMRGAQRSYVCSGGWGMRRVQHSYVCSREWECEGRSVWMHGKRRGECTHDSTYALSDSSLHLFNTLFVGTHSARQTQEDGALCTLGICIRCAHSAHGVGFGRCIPYAKRATP